MVAIKKFRLFLVGALQPVMLWVIVTFAIAVLLFYKLGTLVSGLSQSEASAVAHSQNLQQILDNPLNAQQALLQHASVYFSHLSYFTVRAASAFLGLLAVWLFYYVLRRWYTQRVALLGTALFASSSWFLHTARLGAPFVLQLSLLLALAYGTWIKRTRSRLWPIFAAAFILCWFLYIPGFVWFALAGLFWQRKTIKGLMGQTPLPIMMTGYVLFVLLLVPLARAFILDPSLLRIFAGLPTNDLPNAVDILRNLVRIPEQLFLRGPNNPEIWLCRAS